MGPRLLVVTLYAVATVVMAAPYFNFSGLSSASYPGDVRLIIWTLAWNNHAVLSGRPLFDANVFYPAANSLAYNEHLFGLSLFTLPVHALTGNPVLAYNLVWLLSFLLNAVCMHALLRRYVASHVAALAGALVYTFSFYKMLHAHGHLHLVWTWLLPLSLLMLHRWNDRPTLLRALLWGATVALQSLTSWYLAVLTGLVNAALVLALAVRWRRDAVIRAIHVAAAAVLVAACVWPFAREYVSLPAASAAEARSNSADFAAYLMPPENTWLGRVWLAAAGRGPRWIWGEQTLYLGTTALVLAVIGVVSGVRRRSPAAIFNLALAAAAAWLSFGPARDGTSAFDLLAQLPMLGAFRAPARFALLVLLGVSVLTAFGAARIQAAPRLGNAALAILIPLMLSEWFVVGFPGGKPQPADIPAIYRHPELRTARAIVSLPDYRATPQWWLGADYLLYSTAHWRPIVNGFGRTEPDEHFRVVSHMRAFPGPNNARTMSRLGVDYLVLHADRYGAEAQRVIQEAAAMSEYTLVAQVGNDYLYRLNREAVH